MAKIHDPLDELEPTEYRFKIDHKAAANTLDRAYWYSRMMVDVLTGRLENMPPDKVEDEYFLYSIRTAFEHLHEDISRALSFYEG